MVIFTFSISSLIFYAGRMRKSNSNSHVSLGGVESCGRLGSSFLNRIFEHDAMYSRNTQFALTANRSHCKIISNQHQEESTRIPRRAVSHLPPLHSHPHKKVMIISGRRNKCGNFIEST